MALQQPTADEVLLARAEANGYRRGVHRESDEVRGREKHVTKTKKNQEGTLRRYILWHLGAAKKEAALKGLPPPDEETVRRQHLRANAAAPDLATVKDFLRFYIATSRPRLDADRPTVDSINIVAEWFFAGFTRVTGTETDEEERSEVYNWVRRTLTLEGIVVNKHRPKHNFTLRDLTRVLLALWTRDDLIFIPERYRVQITFIIHVYCWTGARIGAFFTDGLRYKDITLVLQRVDGRRWRLIYKIDQRWVKNNRDPENIVFGAAAKEHEKLFYNDAGFLLAMAIADDALFGYESLEDVRKQRIPMGEDELVLRFKDSALEQPVLRQCTKTGGVTDEPMPRSSFTSILKSTLTNAGYLSGPSIHAIRRQLGKGVDKRYTSVQRSQHLTQADPRVFGQSYVANCSSVDGQAAFRDEECDHRHIDYFQSLEKFHEEGLPDRLPSHLEQKILRDPQLLELDREAQTAVRIQGQPRALNRAKQRYTNLLKKLKLEALRQYQQHWVRERRDWKILTRGKEAAQDKSKTDFVQNICLLIPERGRLAEQMALDRPLEPDEMWQALQALHALCVQDFTVLYLQRSRPVDGACPVKCCQVQLDSLPKPRRNQHIQSCVRWEMAHRLGHLQSEVHYCYHCFDWVIGDQWNSHCQSHLNGLTTKRCGTITSCHTLVRPGYCPFCLSDPDLPASKQMESWTRDHKLWTHISEHITECQWPCVCPHTLCDENFKDATAFQFHLVDEHGLSRTQNGEAAAVATLDSQEDAISNDEPLWNGYPNRKRKKVGSASPLEWMLPQSFPDATTAPTERSPRCPSKRPKQDISTVTPAALSLRDGTSDKQTTQDPFDSLMFYPESSFRMWDDEPTLDVVMSESGLSPTIDGVVDTVETDSLDDGSGFDTLFNQYLRSPTTSPSPDVTASELSGTTLAVTEHRLSSNGTNASKSPEEDEAPDHDTPSGEENLPHIRLRVRQPRIILSLKLPQQGQGGSRPSNKVHDQVDNKHRIGSKGLSRSYEKHQRRRKGHHRRV